MRRRLIQRRRLFQIKPHPKGQQKRASSRGLPKPRHARDSSANPRQSGPDLHCHAKNTCDNRSVLTETLRALIFDMDGLMIDSEPLWWRTEHLLAKEHGLAWTDELALGCVGGGLPNVIRVMQAHGLTLDVDAGVTFLVDAFSARLAELELKSGCRELLLAGRKAGLRLAVASSSTQALVDGVLDRFELRSFFEVVISGEAVLRAKPAPDIFLVAAERLSVAVSEAVVLEDSIAGVQAANSAHIKVIAVPEFERARFAPLTPHVVADLHEARSLLGL